MNVTSHSQALLLADSAHTPPRAEVIEPELRKRAIVVTAPTDGAVIVVHGDYFSRSDGKERSTIADGGYSDSRAPRRDPAQSSAVIKQFPMRTGASLTARNQAALYARVQGADGETVIGSYIDVFA